MPLLRAVKEQRLRLLKEVMFNLFERNAFAADASLLHLEPLGDEFQHSDDIAGLRGLSCGSPGIASWGSSGGDLSRTTARAPTKGLSAMRWLWHSPR